MCRALVEDEPAVVVQCRVLANSRALLHARLLQRLIAADRGLGSSPRVLTASSGQWHSRLLQIALHGLTHCWQSRKLHNGHSRPLQMALTTSIRPQYTSCKKKYIKAIAGSHNDGLFSPTGHYGL